MMRGTYYYYVNLANGMGVTNTVVQKLNELNTS